MSKNDDITTAIRDTRKAKGLSQSDLSSRVGVPQSHISKIENGAVDLKLSSLVQIARALDLEVKLVPRKALPAVESIVRSTKGFPRDRTSQALSEIKKLERNIDNVKIIVPSAKLSLSMGRVETNIQKLKALRYDTDAYVQLRKILNSISQLDESLIARTVVSGREMSRNLLAKDMKKLDRAADELGRLRNSLAHRFDVADKAPRPAYGIEEDDDE